MYVDKSIHILLDQRKPFPFILWQWLVTLIFIFRFYDYWRRIVWTKVSYPFRIRLMLNLWHNGHRNLNSRLWCCSKDNKIFFHIIIFKLEFFSTKNWNLFWFDLSEFCLLFKYTKTVIESELKTWRCVVVGFWGEPLFFSRRASVPSSLLFGSRLLWFSFA